jgi:hypothetical protein
MLKFRIPVAFLIAYIFAMGFVFSSSEQAPPNDNKQPTKTENGNTPQGTTITDHRTNHNSEKRDDKRQWYDTFRKRPTDWLLVLFNGLLVVATIALFISGEKSANAAKTAAEAAKLSAQAAINVELPRLFATKIVFELAALNLVDSESSLHKISVTITNYGRTPAFLYCESAEFIPGPLPAIPIYPNAIDLEPGTIIEKGQLRILTAYGRDNRAKFDVRPFAAGQAPLWVYGIIWFRDFLNEHHAMRFCADLHVPQGLAAGHPPRFIQGGPTAYTESY